MIQGLAIDPFDSNHMLYGTGLTLMGTKNLLNWDISTSGTRKNITLSSLADGIEETAVQGLVAPPSGPLLVSVVADVGGFVHTSLGGIPAEFTNPTWAGVRYFFLVSPLCIELMERSRYSPSRVSTTQAPVPPSLSVSMMHQDSRAPPSPSPPTPVLLGPLMQEHQMPRRTFTAER